MIKTTGLTKEYQVSKAETLKVLKGIDTEIFEGEVITIVGPSGAGKSTLLHIMGTLDKPTKGEVIFDGEDVFRLSSNELARFRNTRIGFVFQFHHLLPEFSAIENVCLAAMISGKSMKSVEQKAKDILTEVGLGERLHHKPSELSGGEAQRVAIARALINSPKVILADEPTGNLDTKNSDEVMHLIFDLRKKYNQTFVIVTHNEKFAEMTDRTLKMVDGVIQV
ncbi:MAG TPA: ABC transporter ATP-binding protein [Ignavibacteria bacterium]|nr:ABC transporter ATP-binding protein [Ignavibacteria bacterium]HRE11105.1 ABC transporter ATP-binding protein [Ignavibacteria bacterium]HRF65910.1 ABC transporter ATP-binding protein [Ignavibacteria bacterium]HRJ04220.1 ABC transporter ATP-binding protein [Ignavibacteria bacterium]HRJ84698.1 ABC transporter ATP-binding protein [Ignavibacteria bacterium]